MKKVLKLILSAMFIFINICLSSGFENAPATKKAVLPAGMVKIPQGRYTFFFKKKNFKDVAVKAFYLDRYPVTNKEYLAFVKANPEWAKSKVAKLFADSRYLEYWKSDDVYGDRSLDNSPVIKVSWFAAKAYSKWKGKRLPTLAEWEYAASAGIKNSKKSLETVIIDWYGKPTTGNLPAVGVLENKYNVFDLHGLVWEWVFDFNSIVMDGDSRSNTEIKRDLFCASGSFGSVNRKDYTTFMRFAYRGSLKANYSVASLGFRCARNAEN